MITIRRNPVSIRKNPLKYPMWPKEQKQELERLEDTLVRLQQNALHAYERGDYRAAEKADAIAEGYAIWLDSMLEEYDTGGEDEFIDKEWPIEYILASTYDDYLRYLSGERGGNIDRFEVGHWDEEKTPLEKLIRLLRQEIEYPLPQWQLHPKKITDAQLLEAAKDAWVYYKNLRAKQRKHVKHNPPVGDGWEPIEGSTRGGYRRFVNGEPEYWFENNDKWAEFEADMDRSRIARDRFAQMARVNGEYEYAPGKYFAIFIDFQDPSKLRVQNFDKSGFWGHEVYRSMEELINEGVRGYYKYIRPAPGILDQLASTEEWRIGSAWLTIRQISNWFNARGRFEMARAIESYAYNHDPVAVAEWLVSLGHRVYEPGFTMPE